MSLTEFYPTGIRQNLEQKDLIVWKYIKLHMPRDRPLSTEEIFALIKNTGVDEELSAAGFARLNIWGMKEYTTLTGVLNNLWWAGYVAKFAEGVYEQSGRPYGVRWIIDEV